MTNHKKSCFCVALGHRQRVTLKKRSRQLFFFVGDILRSLTILSEVWGFVYQQMLQLFVLYYNPYQRYYFLFRCQNTLLYFLLWLQFSNLVQPVVFRRQVTRFEMKRGKHHMRRFGAVFDRRWQWGINLSIWGTTHKNTNNYFWRVFWYDTSNCEVCWKINPQLLKKKCWTCIV